MVAHVHSADPDCMRRHWFLELRAPLRLADGTLLSIGTRLHVAGIAEAPDSWVGAWNIVMIGGRQVVLRGRYEDACPVDSRGREI